MKTKARIDAPKMAASALPSLLTITRSSAVS
jgi:hypothetical protein